MTNADQTVVKFPVIPAWTLARIEEARVRGAMAERVTLPIDDLMELLDLAEAALLARGRA